MSETTKHPAAVAEGGGETEREADERAVHDVITAVLMTEGGYLADLARKARRAFDRLTLAHPAPAAPGEDAASEFSMCEDCRSRPATGFGKPRDDKGTRYGTAKWRCSECYFALDKYEEPSAPAAPGEDAVRLEKLRRDAENVLSWPIPNDGDPLLFAHLQRFAKAVLDLTTRAARAQEGR